MIRFSKYKMRETGIGPNWFKGPIKNKLEKLECSGANSDKMYSKLNMKFKIGDATLQSINSEVDALELLCEVHKPRDHEYEYKNLGDHTFPKDNISYEVETISWNNNTLRNIVAIDNYVTEKYLVSGKYTQLIFGEGPPNVFEQSVTDRKIKGFSETMISTYRFRENFLKCILTHIKKIDGKFKRKMWDGRKVAIIDTRVIPFELEYVLKRISKELEENQEIKLDGVLLMVKDQRYIDILTNAFVVISNPNSSNKIILRDYASIIAKNPIHSEWFYTLTPLLDKFFCSKLFWL